MLRLLIIDDEYIVRAGLQFIIDWNKHGFEICGEASDGREGLNKILSLEPDLVIIDIRMPVFSGIEVIEKAREAGAECRFMILTGYSDFSYAQSAIMYGVSAYLLKPIDEDELVKNIEKVRIEIESVKELNSTVGTSMTKYKLLKNIMLRNIDNIFEIKTLKDMKFGIGCVGFQVAVLGRFSTNKIEIFCSSIQREPNVEAFIFEESIIILFLWKSIANSKEQIEKIYKSMKNKVNKDVILAVGNVVKNIEDIHTSYDQAKEIFNLDRFYLDENVLFYDNISRISNVEVNVNMWSIFDYAEKLLAFVDVGEINQIKSTLEDMGVLFKKEMVSSVKVKSFFINLFVEIQNTFSKTNYDIKDLLPPQNIIISNIYEKDSYTELADYSNQIMVSAASRLNNTNSDNIMKKVLYYIDNNYYKDLKLETLASIFNYNSAYLGKIFKSSVGENFNSYLDKVRIKVAKELLSNCDLKVYQVAEKVGYKNIDYFYSKFKKYVGVSPKEFRNGIGLNED